MKDNIQAQDYSVVIIGGGITGASLLYFLSRYTSIDSIALVEKSSDLAMVASHTDNNSQTLHFGDIETNYTVEKAAKVKEAAEMVVRYLKRHEDEKLYTRSYKMALAVGDREVEDLEKRYEEFRGLFPYLKKIGKDEIGALEPLIVRGRDPQEPLLALYSDDGYAVDYRALTRSFAREAQKTGKRVDIFLNTEVKSVVPEFKSYKVITKDEKILRAEFVVAAAGGQSLILARSLGYGQEFGILPVAGSFYVAKKVLEGKVYTMQMKKLPFAAIHGDPSVTNPEETRFGPTAKVLPLLERYNYRTIPDFLRVAVFSVDGILSLLHILSDKVIFRYVLKNFSYDLPFIGKRLFVKNVQKIIPTITADQIKYGKKIGGIRPQVVNTKTQKMELGEAKIIADNIIFDITPSPGASVCLMNAERNARIIAQTLGASIDEGMLMRELKM